ncbi:MAG: twin-arginine translocase TatA/TatE family subunit [Rickettsiales bacterium]|jgi:sec-independent protein translocase protein TatA|nr:twin-arginine translocase TatA/TatE family subunit [Rickettsiales bacterium]
MRAGFWEILLIVILVLILFGHSKIPDLMKNLANGINIFKKELKGKDDDGAKAKPAPKLALAAKKVSAPKLAVKKAAPKKSAKLAAKKK